ncbi:MAG: methyltransferase family protein [Actinomycetes bacterium]
MLRRAVDWGRVVVAPLFFLAFLLNVLVLIDSVGVSMRGDQSILVPALEATTSLLSCGFFVLLLWAYLSRLRASATARDWRAHAAAALATPLPFVIPFLGSRDDDAGWLLLASVLLVAGLAWSVWSIRHLRQSFSILAQAREVVSSGPYRFVRHPLYAGEVVAALGLVVHYPSWASLGAWVLLCLLQAFRATKEEEVLAAALPEYVAYRGYTSRLVPGLY